MRQRGFSGARKVRKAIGGTKDTRSGMLTTFGQSWGELPSVQDNRDFLTGAVGNAPGSRSARSPGPLRVVGKRTLPIPNRARGYGDKVRFRPARFKNGPSQVSVRCGVPGSV